MDDETKELLKQNLELSQKNNEMLSKLIRVQKFTTIYRIVYWAIIIFSTLGLFYFIKPLIGNLFNAYGVSDVDSFGSFGSNKQQIQDFIDSMK